MLIIECFLFETFAAFIMDFCCVNNNYCLLLLSLNFFSPFGSSRDHCCMFIINFDWLAPFFLYKQKKLHFGAF